MGKKTNKEQIKMFHLKKEKIGLIFLSFFSIVSPLVSIQHPRLSQKDHRKQIRGWWWLLFKLSSGKKWTKNIILQLNKNKNVVHRLFFAHLWSFIHYFDCSIKGRIQQTHKNHAHSFCTRTNYFDYFRKSSSYRFRLIFCLKSTSQLMMREEIYGW